MSVQQQDLSGKKAVELLSVLLNTECARRKEVGIREWGSMGIAMKKLMEVTGKSKGWATQRTAMLRLTPKMLNQLDAGNPTFRLDVASAAQLSRFPTREQELIYEMSNEYFVEGGREARLAFIRNECEKRLGGGTKRKIKQCAI
jgi:hypothetical protein